MSDLEPPESPYCGRCGGECGCGRYTDADSNDPYDYYDDRMPGWDSE